jgi:hypothetical protein
LPLTVGDPRLVRGAALELPRQDVRRDGKGMPGLRRHPEPPPAPGRQAALRIRRATRLRLVRQPQAVSSAWIRGHPYRCRLPA